MYLKNLKYSLLYFLLLPLELFSADPNYTFTHLKVEDGLSQSTIISILQDSKGYIWFGTGNGLNKYNGYSFVVYSNIIDDPGSISSNAVTSIYEDSKGTLWIGTVDGILNKYNRHDETFTRFRITSDIKTEDETETSYDYPVSFSRNNSSSLTSIAEDNAGNLWIGTWGKGIVEFNPLTGKKEYFVKGRNGLNSLSSNKITKILKYSDGSLWIATMGGGLNRLTLTGDGPSFEKFETDRNKNSISDNNIISLMEDNEKNIWICTYTSGINVINPSTGKIDFIKYQHVEGKNSLSSNTVMSVLQDRDGYIWIGTFGGGLDRLDPVNDQFINFRKKQYDENSLSDDDVLTIYEDRSGIIWIGTHLGKGISKLEKNKIKFGLLKNSGQAGSLNDDVVWSIYENQKYLWVGTYRGGLNRMDRQGRFKYYSTENYGISDNHIRAIAEDFKGDIWLGTYSGGLNRMNISQEKFDVFRHNENDSSSIGADQVLSIVIAPDSTFWIGTFGGGLNSFKYNGQKNIKFKKFVNDPNNKFSISDNRVYNVYRTRDGVIWAGTFGGGLNKLDTRTGRFTRYLNNASNPASLSHNRVISIFEDSKGRMWISTYGGGLNLFDRKTEKFTIYTRKQGLSSDVIYGVLEDESGNLWISSDNGLFKYYTEAGRFLQFDLDDGLQSNEFSGGAYYKSSDGELFFGGINGLNYFYPGRISENSNVPPVVITSIKISGELQRGEVKELDLHYNQNFLTFEFAALDFTNPPDNHYEYMLEGLESGWQKSDARYRVANYTNLSPGTYYFKVKGSNNDEIWNLKPAVIKIVIHPPVWETWWFISAAVVFAGLAIYYLSTVRIKNLLAIEKLKTKLAADLHDNIGAGLTEISIMSELASNNAGKDTISLKNISDTARQLVDNMSDIVWVVNPRRDSLHDLIIRLKDMYADLLPGLDISLRVLNLEKLENVKLPMEYKQNLFMILKEAVNNSIKHSCCKKITIDSEVINNIIHIEIKDDGNGFKTDSINLGNGIINMQNRAKSLGGRLKWRSEPGAGTIISFTGRIGRKTAFRSFIENLKE